MFNFFKKNPKGEKVTFKIAGMHCSSCAMSIDSELEETKGVFSANTNFAKAETVVNYDPNLVSKEDITNVINSTGYTIKK